MRHNVGMQKTTPPSAAWPDCVCAYIETDRGRTTPTEVKARLYCLPCENFSERLREHATEELVHRLRIQLEVLYETRLRRAKPSLRATRPHGPVRFTVAGLSDGLFSRRFRLI